MQEANHCGGLAYRQRSKSLSPLCHPASPSRQSADTESPRYGRFDGGCVVAIAAILLCFAWALGRAMASEQASTTQLLSSSSSSRRVSSWTSNPSRDFQLIVESPMSEGK
ncbi:hypothetical protein DFH08DRAFT_973225 [Mycena albidolilacea]|uniref:Uncharacterized protein n=1 Tax=Mycena albidolilacea TaxID=1033008 RepID=A0AAD7EDN2_9AGAR|nr:hypothetical protein DFH08DRAFT_973225 [Mycena albidolilacea]